LNGIPYQCRNPRIKSLLGHIRSDPHTYEELSLVSGA
jgi:hypothetical protein